MDMSALPKAAQLVSLGECAPRWRPGLARMGHRALHSEIFASGDEAGGVACALALALDDMRACASPALEEKPVLWVQDEASRKRSGYPYRPGLPAQLRHRVIHVAARGAQDTLFALEEGMRCRDLAFVIGEIAGNPRALGLTASRRLSLAAEKHGVPLFLIRHDAARDLSSARMRWQVRSAASAPPRWNGDAPGVPSWHAQLFRARAHPPSQWILRDDGTSLAAEHPDPGQTRSPDHGDLAGAAGAGSLAAL
ncbi:hypothetical protein GCM10009127_18680 [Alteraurantiacibacter aestuarii]|uniref:hypothetical protein n=1 Tax=Alteraurantiacibacter aestuarii TaxID=650004 RepID=UPI0031D3C41D